MGPFRGMTSLRNWRRFCVIQETQTINYPLQKHECFSSRIRQIIWTLATPAGTSLRLQQPSSSVSSFERTFLF